MAVGDYSGSTYWSSPKHPWVQQEPTEFVWVEPPLPNISAVDLVYQMIIHWRELMDVEKSWRQT